MRESASDNPGDVTQCQRDFYISRSRTPLLSRSGKKTLFHPKDRETGVIIPLGARDSAISLKFG